METLTLVLNHDGRDLAAAWQTILEVGDDEALAACLDDAFPGARVEIRKVQGSFDLLFHQQGLLRPLTLAELSDGTLRYLLWIAALLSPRAAGLMVLNEPKIVFILSCYRPLPDYYCLPPSARRYGYFSRRAVGENAGGF